MALREARRADILAVIEKWLIAHAIIAALLNLRLVLSLLIQIVSTLDLIGRVVLFARAKVAWDDHHIMHSRSRLELIIHLLLVAIHVHSLLWCESRDSTSLLGCPLVWQSIQILTLSTIVETTAVLTPLSRCRLSLIAIISSGCSRTHLVDHLRQDMRRCLVVHTLQPETLLVAASLPRWIVIIVERRRCDALHMDAHGFRFLQNPLKAVDQVLMIVVTFIDVKNG